MISDSKIVLHFAHANGFPSGSYNKLFSALPDDFNVLALDKFGHAPHFPVSNNWGNQVEELIEYIEQTANGPVYAVGHSFGGVVSYMAVCSRPDLFKGLIMLDPPVITGMTRFMFRMLKFTPLIDKVTPAGKTQRRCTRWTKNTDIVAYFKARALFKDIDTDCIQDYVNSVMKLQDGHYNLNFSADIEANIFRNVPSNINQYYNRVKCPALLVTGEHTTVCTARLIEPFIKGNKIEHSVFKQGGHMFPLEKPVEVADLVAKTITKWEQRH